MPNRSNTSSETGWTCFTLPAAAPEKLDLRDSVELEGKPEVDPCFGIDPDATTESRSPTSPPSKDATREGKRWMEKFGEWKHAMEVSDWKPGGAATWEIECAQTRQLSDRSHLFRKRRLVWTCRWGTTIQNQQNSSSNHQTFPIGWIEFKHAGRQKISVSCIEGETASAALRELHITPLGDLSKTPQTVTIR